MNLVSLCDYYTEGDHTDIGQPLEVKFGFNRTDVTEDDNYFLILTVFLDSSIITTEMPPQ